MENESEPENLIKVKITHLIKFSSSFAGVEIHLLINNKFIKMNYANEQFIDILRKLQQKEVEEVYVQSEDCKKILDEIQSNMSSKTFYDPKSTDEHRMQAAESSVEVVKGLMTQMKIDKQTVEILKSANKKTQQLVEESPSIFLFMKKFKESCSEEFLRSVLTSYVTSMVIDKFPWKSTPVKEKAALASMLCDITLQKDDFVILRNYEKNGGDLPEHIKNHPKEVSNLLSQNKDIIPSENSIMNCPTEQAFQARLISHASTNFLLSSFAHKNSSNIFLRKSLTTTNV